MKRYLSSSFFILYGLFIFFSSRTYFLNYPMPQFILKIISICSALFLLLGLTGIGFSFLLIFKKSQDFLNNELSILEKQILSFGLGTGIFGTLILILGWAVPGTLGMKFPILTGLLFLGTGVSIWETNKRGFSIPGAFSKPFSFLEFILGSIAMGGLLSLFIACFSPITYYDSLVYHLSLPSSYLQSGKIAAVSNNLYSFFPALTEMIFLYILGQFPEPEYTINLILCITSLLSALLVSEWAYKISGLRSSRWSLFLWFTMPALLLLSLGGYVEIPLAFFTLLSIWMFWIACESKFNSMGLFLSLFLSGFCISVKYTGAITVIYLVSSLLFLCLKKSQLNFKTFVLLSLVASIPISPWLIKNYIAIGNPVFPFLYDFFPSKFVWTQENARGYFLLLTEYGNKSNVFFDLLKLPFNLSKNAASFGGGFDVLGDFGWLPFIFLTPLAFFLKDKKKLKFVGLYTGFHFFAWFIGKPVLRFLIGGIPSILLISSLVLNLVSEKIQSSFAKFLYLMLSVFLASNIFLYYFIAHELQIFNVAMGWEEKSDFLHRRLPFYSMFEYVNSNLKENEKILLIGEQRTYHLKVPFESSNLFAPSLISEICNNSKSTMNLREYFSKSGITHLLINKDEIERLGGWEKFGFSSEGFSILNEFITKNTLLINSERNIGVYQVLSTPL